MTMGLPCDSDGYDLRIDQCRICGSRGCPKKHSCKDVAPRDDIAGLSERLRRLARITRRAIETSKMVSPWSADSETLEEAATQLDSLLKERDALQARVKELESGIAHAQYRSDNCDAENQSLYNRLEAVESRALRAEQERDVFEAQLPDGMKHCTITFHECEKGHGWLSATNWIDNGCLCCQRDEAYERAAKVADSAADIWNADGCLLEYTSVTIAAECEGIADAIRRLAGPEKEKKE